jgi:hypothetical protein
MGGWQINRYDSCAVFPEELLASINAVKFFSAERVSDGWSIRHDDSEYPLGLEWRWQDHPQQGEAQQEKAHKQAIPLTRLKTSEQQSD